MPLSHQRLEDWPDRLMRVLDLHRSQPFTWGRYDCATLWGDCCFALTGTDPLKPFKPWSSAVSALRALSKAGHVTAADLVHTLAYEIDPMSAGRGDFGYTADAAHRVQFPAVVTGSEAVSRNEDGFVVFPRSLIVAAYRIA